MGISVSTAYETVSRWEKHQSLDDLPRSGRPRKLSNRDERHIIANIRRHPAISAKKLSIEYAVSDFTIRTLLKMAWFCQ
jgi:transposase